MRYPSELVPGTLLSREKRFLAEVQLADGQAVTAHVPNSGRMTGCSEPGSPCLLLPAPPGRRRLEWTLEQVTAFGVAVGVNTLRANRLAEEALTVGLLALPGLGPGYALRREVAAGDSRFDLRLDDGHGAYWVEVKNVTLVRGRIAEFPDAVTARGARHLRELAALVRHGDRAAVVFVVQRRDAEAVRAAADVDPVFAAALASARAAGVTAHALRVAVTPRELIPERRLVVE